MNFQRARGREEPEINFIPLIDVLLVILIFVLVTTTYARISELKIDLPEAGGDPTKQAGEINVGIDASGRYSINRVVFTYSSVAAISEQLQQAAKGNNDPIIVINADANTTHQSVIHVMEAAQRAGYQRITFATQSPR
jgi:biopolymer transport protein ExbD